VDFLTKLVQAHTEAVCGDPMNSSISAYLSLSSLVVLISCRCIHPYQSCSDCQDTGADSSPQSFILAGLNFFGIPW
jgi:hypothetical protein